MSETNSIIKLFKTTDIYEYNYRRKFLEGFFIIFSLLSIFTFIIIYFLKLKHVENTFLMVLKDIVIHVKTQMFEKSLIGIMYTSFFGGMFFLPIPMEAVFTDILGSGKSFALVIFIYLLGLTIAYSFNYFVGLKFSYLSKKVITERKFYKIKAIINKYGKVGIFLINAIPFLPSQPLSTILGVFKYNKTKFYVLFLSGQLLKYVALTVVFFYVL